VIEHHNIQYNTTLHNNNIPAIKTPTLTIS